MSIGVVTSTAMNAHDFRFIQTPDCKTLDNMVQNLVDWYSSYLISRKDKLRAYPERWLQAFFQGNFPHAYVWGWFPCISRFRNDVVLYYPTLERKQENVVIPVGLTAGLTLPIWIWPGARNTRWTRENYTDWCICKSSQKVCFLGRLCSDGWEDRQSGSFISATDDSMVGCEVLDYYRTRFQLEFCFRDGKRHVGNHQLSVQLTSESWIFTSMHRLPLSTWPKAACKRLGIA